MRIIDAGQYVSLEGASAGKILCRITIRTDDGRQVSIPTSEDTVTKIIELMTGVEAPSSTVGTTTDYQEALQAALPQDASFFGGSDQVESPAPNLGIIAEEAPPRIERPAGLGQGLILDAKGYPIQGRVRTVDKDEFGYPIMPKSSAPPPPEIEEEEEDPGEQI